MGYGSEPWKDEDQRGAQWVKENTEKYGLRQAEHGSLIEKIEDEIIRSNSETLAWKQGRTKGVALPWITSRNHPHDWAGKAVGGSHIIVNGNSLDRFYSNGKTYDIVRNSQIANLLAHEIGHYAKRHGKLLTLGQLIYHHPRGQEHTADRLALEYTVGTPTYSPGSALWNATSEKKDKRGYMTEQEVTDWLKKLSGGRVALDATTSRLTVDGKKFMGTGKMPQGDRDSAEARTEYLAGQIAACMAKGVFKKSHLATRPETWYFADGRKNHTVLVATRSPITTAARKTDVVKVLGTFDYDEEKTKVSRNYHEREEMDCVKAIRALAD